jgi:hypothetical protein
MSHRPLQQTSSQPKAKVGHTFCSLKSGLLISVGQFCEEDCVALFTKHSVEIYKNGEVIIVGERNTTNSLWNVPLPPKEIPLPQILPASPAIPPKVPSGTPRKAGSGYFPSCLRFQSTPFQVPSCNSTWPFQLVAQSHPCFCHQAPFPSHLPPANAISECNKRISSR